ncbi:MAG: biotin/lipoyl-binding protein [Fuerstiella sp.]
MKPILNIVGSLLIIVAGIVGLKIFGQKPEVPREELSPESIAAAVRTAEVSAWNRPFNLTTDGEAVTYRVVTVGAEVEGRVVQKSAHARGGSYVNAGDLLFRIDPTRYQLEIDRLTAQLNHADEELAAVSVDLKNTTELIALAEEDWQLQKNHLNRMLELLRRKTANDTEVEASMMQELAARNSLQMLRNQQRTLTQQLKTRQAASDLVKAQLEQARFDLARCTVVSPLEGRIVEDEVEEGDYVKAGDVLIHISDGSRMEIKCQLRAEELAWVWQQSQAAPETSEAGAAVNNDPLNLPPVPCEVAFEFEGVETIWDGYIGRLEGTGIDRATRTFPCRVFVDHPHQTRFNDSAGGRPAVSPPVLLSGMYVTLRIPVESPASLLQLPIEAVRPGGQVWVSDNGRLRVTQVTVATVAGESVLVKQHASGLKPGDRVIVSPLASVQDGLRVVEAEESDE